VLRRRRLLPLLFGFVVWLAAAWFPAARAQVQPILILISLDGFRADYLNRVDLPHLRLLAARGVRSEGLIPSFPTLTFPNHWTIVTGLRPDRHGIVSNTMVDRSIGPARFSMSAPTATDPRWWGGEPIWTTAMRQGRKTASMFWPGSEAVLPTHWKRYDTKFPNQERLTQVLEWLSMSESERPTFITMYFSDVDSAAHSNGPDAPATFAAAQRVDELMGRLVAGLAQAGLLDRTNIVVVSDHGLAETSVNRLIVLDDYISRNDVEVVDSGAWLGINPGPKLTVDSLVTQLSGRHPALKVYRKEALPAALHYGSHSRIPAVVGLLDPGWLVVSRDLADRNVASGWKSGGAHGYSNAAREMHALFVAAGPRIQRGRTIPPLDNIHLYAFMCDVLGLTPAPNDGDPSRIAALTVR
jgi:predicted AlkP superfamily pyrophosphatase or phosphodiesterase